MRNYKNSLCWDCANFSKCTWSRGKAVDGWIAKKVMVKDSHFGDFKTYFVQECPHYEEDRIVKVSYANLAIILDEDEKYIQNAIHRHIDVLQTRLAEKGYRLRRYEGNCYWWLERLD